MLASQDFDSEDSREQANKVIINYLDQLAALVKSEVPCTVIIVMRIDFTERAFQFPQFAPLLHKEANKLLGPLSEDELRRAIQRPAERQHIELHAELVDILIDAIKHQKGGLALVQYVLNLLWDRRTGEESNAISLEDYSRTGGLGELLEKYADTFYEETLTTEEQSVCPKLFLRLINVGKEGDVSRRVAELDQFSEAEKGVIEKLADARLVTNHSGRSSNTPLGVREEHTAYVEVAHALIHHWPKLRIWIEENRSEISLRNHLGDRMSYWIGNSQQEGWLLKDAVLARANEWLTNNPGLANATEKAFIDASNDKHQDLLRTQFLKEQKANYNLAKAYEEKALLDKEQLQALVSGEPVSPQRLRESLLYALEAARQDLPIDKTALTPQALNQLSLICDQDLSTERKRTPIFDSGRVEAIAYSPDGKFIVSNSGDMLRLWDAQSGEMLKALKGHTGPVSAVAYSPNGKIIASGSGDKTVRLWNAESGEALKPLQGHTGPVSAVAYSPDGKIIASGSEDKTVRLWDTESGEMLKTLQKHTRPVSTVAYSPNGKVLASGSEDKTVRLWDTESGETLKTLQRGTDSVRALAYSPDGKVIAFSLDDATVRLRDIKSGDLLETLRGHSAPVYALVYSLDGNTIASGSDDYTVRLWSSISGKTLKILQGHLAPVHALAYSPKDKVIASGSKDNTMRLWDTEAGETLKGHSHFISCLTYNPNGKVVASGSQDNTVRLWEVESGKTLKILQGHTDGVSVLAYHPNGKVIASGSIDKTVRLWDPESGKTLNILSGHSGWITGLVFSPDGKAIASASGGDSVRLWDAKSGKILKRLRGRSQVLLYTLAYSPDGKTIASGSFDTTVRLWDTQSGQTLNVLQGHTDVVMGVAYSPDGKVIASGASDSSVRLWDVESGQSLKILKILPENEYTHVSLGSLAYSPDGKVIAAGLKDGTIRLWDVESGEALNTLRGQGWITALAFKPDGKVIASGSKDVNTPLLLKTDNPIHQLIYDFNPYTVSDALKFLWEMEIEDLEMIHQPRTPSLFPQEGYYITWTDETRKYRPLLDMPRPNETKLDQLIRWLEEQCAYKHPERYGCKPIDN